MTLGFAWIPVLALANQKLSLSSLFSDHMVLQQNKIEVNYEIAGDNTVHLQAEAMMSGNKIVVSNPTTTNSVYVRYAWSDSSSTTLFNKDRANQPIESMSKKSFLPVLLFLLFGTLLSAQQAVKTKSGSKKVATATPCMDVLKLFTAQNVPEFGPDETPAKTGNWVNGITPANLPGKGLAQHPMLIVGENYDKMFLVKDGKVIWTYSTGTSYEYDDVWMLSNGNILFTRMEYVAEITPDKKVVWRYDCNPEPGAKHTEVHTCQPIGLDKVMFVVNGLPPKLMIVNIKTGVVEVKHELPCSQPDNPNGIHGQFRRARVTAQGTYLVSVFGMGYIAEYDKNFNEIWRFNCKQPWSALRLKNGNTLITNEADAVTSELNPKGEVVWQINTKTDLPESCQFSSNPQTCTRLANGNTIFTSRGDNEGHGPQLVEVNLDKQVVWVLQDWKTIGPVTTVQILDDPGIPEIPGQSEH